MCMTCLNRMCDMTHSYTWHDWHIPSSATTVIENETLLVRMSDWLIRMRNMTHSRQDPFLPTIIHQCNRNSDMENSDEWHDWLIRMRVVTESQNGSGWRTSQIPSSITWVVHEMVFWSFSNVVNHSYVWHDSLRWSLWDATHLPTIIIHHWNCKWRGILALCKCDYSLCFHIVFPRYRSPLSWVMSHICMSHFLHTNESYHT